MPLIGMIGCLLLVFNLNTLVLKVYCISCPIGLIIYFSYGFWHSRLRHGGDEPADATTISSPAH